MSKPVITERVSQSIRQGTVTDIYALVKDLKREFRDVPGDKLERIVSEEIISAHGNAVWDRRR